MRTLSASEIYQVNGGFQNNLYESLMISGAFASIFSLAGIVAGASWYLESANKAYSMTTIFAYAGGHAMVTFPVAIFAGIGLGGCIGAITGYGLYFAGIATFPE